VIVAERTHLIPVKVLISDPLIHLELFENAEGNLFLSSSASEPEGMVYYATTPSLFYSFLAGLISLQTLFDKSPSRLVEISSGDKTALYSRSDIEIKLVSGDRTIKELTNHCPIEGW